MRIDWEALCCEFFFIIIPLNILRKDKESTDPEEAIESVRINRVELKENLRAFSSQGQS